LSGNWDAASSVDVHVYDVRGRRVGSFSTRAAGGLVTWDGRTDDGLRAPAGSYVIVFDDGIRTVRTKVTLTR